MAVLSARFRLSAALLLGSLLACTAAAWPAQAQRSGALSSFNVLRMEASTRAAALGGAFSAVNDGADAGVVFYQPAAPSDQAHNAVSASYLNHLEDLNAGFLSYSREIGGLGTASAGLRFFSYGDFDGRDTQGNETGDFGASDVALTLGLARSFSERFRYGANLHVIHGSMEEAGATAVAADLGVLYQIPAQQFTVSASLHNIGTSVDSYYGRDGTELPLDLRLGVSKKLLNLPLRVSAAGTNLHDFDQSLEGTSSFDRVMRHVALGAELTPVEALALRLGYSHRRQELAESDRRVDPAGLSTGFGLTIRRISVDYAFTSWSSIGGLHQFGLRAQL